MCVSVLCVCRCVSVLVCDVSRYICVYVSACNPSNLRDCVPCHVKAVLWTLWSRMVRLHCYLRQLLAETPAHKAPDGAAAKQGNWSALVDSVDAEVQYNGCDKYI